MEEKDLLLLKTLHEEKNLTKAAERLYVSQPALTYRLQQIEKEFDTRVVNRSKKGVEFTAQGEVLVELAKNMIIQQRKAKEMIKDMENNVQGVLRIGVSSNYARYQLPNLLKKFLKQYPDVEIHVQTGFSSEVTQHVLKDDVHIGIVRGDIKWQEQKHLLCEEPICIVSNKEIDLKQLPELPRINYKTDPHLKNTIEQWWQSHFTKPPSITMEVDRIETCKEMVLNGLGYGIFPSICLTENDNLWTTEIKLNHKPISRKTWMIYRRETPKLKSVKAFVDFIKENENTFK
jgi:DNA-binding transcriptional LysR family regulator